jgi:hypothetical protein
MFNWEYIISEPMSSTGTFAYHFVYYVLHFCFSCLLLFVFRASWWKFRFAWGDLYLLTTHCCSWDGWFYLHHLFGLLSLLGADVKLQVFPSIISPSKAVTSHKEHALWRHTVGLTGYQQTRCLNKDRSTWCHLLYYFTIYCSACFEC